MIFPLTKCTDFLSIGYDLRGIFIKQNKILHSGIHGTYFVENVIDMHLINPEKS
jgi:hypothetical protein